MGAVPNWVLQGLGVAGNILPALGFALTMVIIGKRNFIPFFILGFFVVAYTGISIVGIAIFAFCMAAIYTHFQPNTQQRQG
jgi:D-glucosaminate-specific PTS system IIC component